MSKAPRNLNRRKLRLLVSVDAFADAIRATGASPLTYLPHPPPKTSYNKDSMDNPKSRAPKGSRGRPESPLVKN